MRIKKISFSLYKMLKLSVDLKIDLKLTSNQCKELVDFIDNPLEVEEFCEWKHKFHDTYETKHGSMVSESSYIFCPKCGKRIKRIKYVESEE